MSLENSEFKKQADEEDSIEALKENLYSRHDFFSSRGKSRDSFKKHDIDASEDWGDKDLVIKGRVLPNPAEHMAFLKKIFVVSIGFFIISIAVALYVFFGGANVISANNVDISIIGPVSIAGGEVLSLEIQVSNQNNTNLETADLVIDYPDGTRQAEDTKIPLKRYREALGAIEKGGTVTKKVQAVLFGEAGDVKEITIAVEYRVTGSNAIFPKEKKYIVTINSSPVTITVNAVKEINANQDTELSIEVVSNATAVVQKLVLAAEYPFGFSFKNSDPVPSSSNSFWQLGDLKPGVKRTVKVWGTIAGQDSEDRTFHFSVGTASPENENSIGTNFLTTTQKITIRKPFIGANLALDGDLSDTYIAKPGKSIRADLTVTNNAGSKITDVKISVKPAGSIFDSSSVTMTQGFYRSSDNTILWDQTFLPSLTVLNPDDTINLSFSVSTVSEEQIRSMKNPKMDIVVTVTGKRQNESGLSQDVTSSIVRIVRVASTLGLSARALYYSGPFINTGPIPPTVNSDTSYTVIWSLTNGSNDFSNTKIAATLPSYVKWLGVTAPAEEKISYNPIGGQIMWEVGSLKAGTGFSGSPRQVNFQISLSPSMSQVNSQPILVGEATASGDDNFAGQSVETGSRAPLTTELTTDISFKSGQGTVVK